MHRAGVCWGLLVLRSLVTALDFGLWLINCPLCSVGVSWANKRTANAPLNRLLGSDTHGSNPDPVLVADLQVPSELSQMLVLVLSTFGASLIF